MARLIGVVVVTAHVLSTIFVAFSSNPEINDYPLEQITVPT